MGNCLKTNKVGAQSEVVYQVVKQARVRVTTSSNKKVVRLKLLEKHDHNINVTGKKGINESVVRVRVVMKREELKQLLLMAAQQEEECLRVSSMEQLVNELKLRGRFISHVKDATNWMPVLETIPE
ncbi:hypothetical protein ACFE04_018084 [Oxalis oulophora]